MITAIVVLRLFAASQVLLCACALAMSQNPPRARMLGTALALGVVSYLVVPLVYMHIGPGVAKGFVLPADAIPPLLFLFTWELFEDDRPPVGVWLLGLIYHAAVSLTHDPLITELTRLMSEERLYADHHLRIGSVAARLKVPEYQLRRAINQRLGYRNFNQFINQYRIDEAARRLHFEPNITIRQRPTAPTHCRIPEKAIEFRNSSTFITFPGASPASATL